MRYWKPGRIEATISPLPRGGTCRPPYPLELSSDWS